MMINGAYPFPWKKLAAGEIVELSLELSLPFTVAYLIASPTNAEGLWVDDILIGKRSLVPPNCGPIPWEIFYSTSSVRVTFDDAEIPIGVAIRIKVRNMSTESRTARMSVFGTSRRGDC